MTEFNDNIMSRKTWMRNIEPVSKIGYMDGAADGQSSAYQESFNVGYKQGLAFGLELGFMKATNSFQSHGTHLPPDQHRINCHICTNVDQTHENIVNLYNSQQEKNTEYLLECNNTK